MGGSAIAADFYNHLTIEDNTLTGNGPVTSYAELEHSPYVKNLLSSDAKKPLTLNYIEDCEATGELEFIDQCSGATDEFIDLPTLRGAIYIRNIQTDM